MCGLCQQEHEKAIIEFELDGKVVKWRSEFCPGLNAWVIKFNPLVNARAGFMILTPKEVTIISKVEETKK